MPLHESMKGYMRDIKQIPLITVEEEVELAARIKKGDLIAKEKLIGANLRLVVKIAHDFKGMGFSLPDLVSEGNMGLIRATEKFDPAKGAKFSSYAAWWIKQAMRRAISEKSKTIRIPVASVSKMLKIRKMYDILENEYQREPTNAEIAAKVELSEKVVRRLRLSDTKTISLHDPILRGEDGELTSLIPDEKTKTPFKMLDQVETEKRLGYLMQNLNDREKYVISLRFGLGDKTPLTLEEISKHIGRTRERVRQIQQRALQKIKFQYQKENA